MWLTCSGSLILNILAPDNAGEDAAYGTVAHGLTEGQLKTGKAPVHRIGEEEVVNGFTITIDEEMLSFVQQCVDYCEWLAGDHFVEQRVYFSQYTPLPNQSGTADHVACEPGLMTITDHKFGKGIMVHAAQDLQDPRPVIFKLDGTFELNGNPQGLWYALGFFLKHDAKYAFQRIVIRVAQPRLDHFEEWETTREHLLAFAEWAKWRAYAAWEPVAPLRPSEKGCQWCKIKSECSAHAAFIEDLVSDAFADLACDIEPGRIAHLNQQLDEGVFELAPQPLARLTTAQMARILPFRGLVESWFKTMAETLLARANMGEDVPGWKMVESRSHRVFKDDSKAKKALLAAGVPLDEIEVTSMVTPAEAEKALRRHGVRARDLPEVMEGLTRKPPGSPTLVRDVDRRQALGSVADGAFDDLTVI